MQETILVIINLPCWSWLLGFGIFLGGCATDIPEHAANWIPPLVVFVEDNLAASELIYNFTFTSDNGKML